MVEKLLTGALIVWVTEKQLAERVGSTQTQTAITQNDRVAKHQKSQLVDEVCVTLSKVPYYSIEERLK